MPPSTARATVPPPESPRWWRVPMVWLVIGGPLVVVVASFATLVIALTHPDPVLTAPPAAHAAELPAVQARNHVVSPAR
ncbi:MAG: hypothetical protein ABI696_13885 [Rubrivivax sp.]